MPSKMLTWSKQWLNEHRSMSSVSSMKHFWASSIKYHLENSFMSLEKILKRNHIIVEQEDTKLFFLQKWNTPRIEKSTISIKQVGSPTKAQVVLTFNVITFLKPLRVETTGIDSTYSQFHTNNQNLLDSFWHFPISLHF